MNTSPFTTLEGAQCDSTLARCWNYCERTERARGEAIIDLNENSSATGSLQKPIVEAGASVVIIPSLVDCSQLALHCRFPVTQTMRQVLEVLGSNVVVGETHTGGNLVDASLMNRPTGKHITLKLQVPKDSWPRLESHLRGAWPFGVQVACCIFEFVSGKEFGKDANRLLDLLGLKRDAKGYHYGGNVGRLNDALDLFECLLVPHYKQDRKKGKVLDSYEPFLRQTVIPATAHSGVNYRVGVDTTRGYGWLYKRWFQIDANRHPYAVLLYPYLSRQWQIGWHQHEGTFKRNVPAVLRDVGIPYDRKHFGRTVDTLKKEVNYLRRNEFVYHYGFPTKDGRLFLSVEAPEKHPVRTLRKGREST